MHTPEHAGRTLFHRSWRAASSHVSPHPSRIYGVYENPPWPQFLCKQARQRRERGLAPAVTVGRFVDQALNLSERQLGIRQTLDQVRRLSGELPKTARHHHHACIWGKEWLQRSCQQQRAEHIEVPNLTRGSSINAGVVD